MVKQDFKSPATAELLPAICLDIETCHASLEAIEAEIALYKGQSNWKAETIEANKEKHADKVREKSALLDSAPIATIGICDQDGDAVVFHWLRVDSGKLENSVLSIKAGETERDMLLAFRDFSNTSIDRDTAIVGFNLGFDLPKLRLAYVRHGLKPPEFLLPNTPNQSIDVMRIFTRYYSTKDLPFVGLDEVIKRLGIAPEGKQMEGKEAPVYVAKGFEGSEPDNNQWHKDLIIYNALDVLLTMRAFLILTGQTGD